VGFRGTARYASIGAHFGKDLGRVDDLWSLFYIVVEFLAGTLPWKGKEKDKIGQLKEKYTQYGLMAGLPQQLIIFYNHLIGLKYDEKPNYGLITDCFVEMFEHTGMASDVTYDWDCHEETVSYHDDSAMIVDDEMVVDTATDERQQEPLQVMVF
jgi:tau tubulin kinase